jgi:hypothetical protein
MVMAAINRHPEYKILFTNSDLSSYLGNPLRMYSRIALTLRFNEVSSGEFTSRAYPWLMDVVNLVGTRVVVMRDGVIILAGPIEDQGPYLYNAETDGEDGDGTVTIRFADDLSIVAGRLAYPNPAQAATAQTSARYVISGVNGELAMRALVNLNAGPGALTARQIPSLILGSLASVGTNVSYSARFEPLCDSLRAVAIAAGGLGFRTQQVGNTIEFQVYEPDDLTESARFGRNIGNIRTLEYQVTSPIATVAIVGGQDAGADRHIRERSNAAAIGEGWPRRETFVDRRDIDNNGELDSAGDEELTNNAVSIRLVVGAIDTQTQRYPDDYNLGDVVSSRVLHNVMVPEIVRAVEIEMTPEGGETITPTIGTQEAALSNSTVTLQRKLQRTAAFAGTAGEIAI